MIFAKADHFDYFDGVKKTGLLNLLILFGFYCSSADKAIDVSSILISIDGDFTDWNAAKPVYQDNRGEIDPPGIDFGDLWISQIENDLFFKIETDREIILQNSSKEESGNDIRLYVDTDRSSQTGYRKFGMGIDLEIHFGSKRAFLYSESGGREVSLNEIQLLFAPTHSSDKFEFRIPNWAAGPSEFRFFLEDKSSGDRIPNQDFITASVSGMDRIAVDPIDVGREDDVEVRVLSFNVLKSRPVRFPEPFQRFLKAFNPDIINFQEMLDWDQNQTARFVENSVGGNWYSSQVADCVTVSRWPIKYWSGIDGNLLSQIELPETISDSDLVIFNAHTPCCGNNAGRDWEHDHIAATWRNLKDGKGPFQIEQETPMMILGDLNMVGFSRQLKNLRDGDIYDNQTFGPDFKPSWQGGSMLNVPLRHSHSNWFYTWRNDRDRFTPGKLDYILYLDDSMTLLKSFAIYTPEMPEEILTRLGLVSDDSLVSDHLVLIADFRLD